MLCLMGAGLNGDKGDKGDRGDNGNDGQHGGWFVIDSIPPRGAAGTALKHIALQPLIVS